MLTLPIDVADASVEHAAAAVEAGPGPTDVWGNDARVSVFSPVKEAAAQRFRRVTGVTCLGSVHGSRAALRRMLPRDRGNMVQVGSALSYRASKHAVEGFTESFRSEPLHDGGNVRVTMVQAPALDTLPFGWVRSRRPNAPQPAPPVVQPGRNAPRTTPPSRDQ